MDDLGLRPVEIDVKRSLRGLRWWTSVVGRSSLEGKRGSHSVFPVSETAHATDALRLPRVAGISDRAHDSWAASVVAANRAPRSNSQGSKTR
jgi:hypothetical protein